MVEDPGLRDRGALYSYLALATSFNEADMCALLQCICGVNVYKGNAEFNHSLEAIWGTATSLFLISFPHTHPPSHPAHPLDT